MRILAFDCLGDLLHRDFRFSVHFSGWLLDHFAWSSVFLVTAPLAVVALIMAIVLVTWGARTDRRWTVVVAATLALPTLWFHGLAMLVGVVAIQRGLPERASTSLEWLKVFSRSPRRLRPEHRIRPSARPAR